MCYIIKYSAPSVKICQKGPKVRYVAGVTGTQNVYQYNIVRLCGGTAVSLICGGTLILSNRPPSLILNLNFFPLTMFVYTCRQTGHSRPPPRTQSHLGRMLSSSLEEDCLKPSIRELKTYIEIVHIFPIYCIWKLHSQSLFHIFFSHIVF